MESAKIRRRKLNAAIEEEQSPEDVVEATEMSEAAEKLDKKLSEEQKRELMEKYFGEMMRKTNRRRMATKKKVTPSQRKRQRLSARSARRKNRK